MISYKVINNPTQFFATPEEVVQDTSITVDDKIAVLRSWEHDLRELSVAEEENMGGESDSSLMMRVNSCLTELGYENSHQNHSHNKQGD